MASFDPSQTSGNSPGPEEVSEENGPSWTVERVPLNLLTQPVNPIPQPHLDNRAVTRLTVQNQGNFLGQMVDGFENSYGPPGPPRVIPTNLQAQQNQFLASMTTNPQNYSTSQGQMSYQGGQRQVQNTQMSYQQGYSYVYNGQQVFTGNYGQQQPLASQYYQGNQVRYQDQNGNWFQTPGQYSSGQASIYASPAPMYAEPQYGTGSCQQAEQQPSAQAQSQGRPRTRHRSSRRSQQER